MRSLIGRFLRLELVTTIGIALALPALALPTAETGSELAGPGRQKPRWTAEYHDQGGRTYATLSVAVTYEEAQPATGAVVIQDAGKPLAGVALNAQGEATVVVSLLPGEHSNT